MSKHVYKSIVSSKGQIVLPKPVREQMRIRKGTTVEFREENGKMVMEVARFPSTGPGSVSHDDFIAMIPEYNGPPISEKTIRDAITKEARRRWNAQGD